MSFDALKAVEDTPAPSPSAKLLMFILASFAGPDAICYPSHASLAAKTGLSLRAVKSNMMLLQQAGLIAAVRRRRADGSQTSNGTRLLFVEPVDVTTTDGVARPRRHKPVKPTEPVPEEQTETGRVQILHPDRVQIPPPQSADSAPLTSFEPVSFQEPSSRRAGAPANERPKTISAGKRTPLPADFPDQAALDWAAERAAAAGAALDARHQAELFAGHARQEGRRVADWQAAWRNWIVKLTPLPAAPRPSAVRPAGVPPEIHALVVAEAGEAFAHKWLYGCEWLDGRLLVPSPMCATQLKALAALAPYPVFPRPLGASPIGTAA